MNQMPAVRVIHLEDDVQLRDQVVLPGLRMFGVEAKGVGCAAELYKALLLDTFDVALLDINVPGEDGLAVAHYLRGLDQRIGIIMVSAVGEDASRIEALQNGADAFIAKPASVEVIVATIHSVIRRIVPAQSGAGSGGPRGAGEVGWFLTAAAGHIVPLSRTERIVLNVLHLAAGAPVSRETIIAALTDDVYDFDPHRVDVVVHRLRKKLQEAGASGMRVVTVRGSGYALSRDGMSIAG